MASKIVQSLELLGNDHLVWAVTAGPPFNSALPVVIDPLVAVALAAQANGMSLGDFLRSKSIHAVIQSVDSCFRILSLPS